MMKNKREGVGNAYEKSAIGSTKSVSVDLGTRVSVDLGTRGGVDLGIRVSVTLVTRVRY